MKNVNPMDFKTVSSKLKERFCKDNNIPITIFTEPYFKDRMILYDTYFHTLKMWARFGCELYLFDTEQDYFEHYNNVKDKAINFIKNTDGYQKFINEDMKEYLIVNNNIPNKDIYKPTNDGKTFISIDMKSANFSALQFYDPEIFGSAVTWEEFIGKFTDNQHIIASKYIRQVILGNCNAGRQVAYEKYLMDGALCYLLNDKIFDINNVVCFTNDEVVIDVSDMIAVDQIAMYECIKKHLIPWGIPLKVELFKLIKIHGTHGYIKEIFGEHKNHIKIKCLDSFYLPFVIRILKNQEVEESDKMFYHNGLLAKFIEIPKIEVML